MKNSNKARRKPKKETNPGHATNARLASLTVRDFLLTRIQRLDVVIPLMPEDSAAKRVFVELRNHLNQYHEVASNHHWFLDLETYL